MPTFWHGTPVANKSAIERDGIKPRTMEDCDELAATLLRAAGVGSPRDLNRDRRRTFQWGDMSCRETTGRVYLAAAREYAVSNCLAGEEAMVQMLDALRPPRARSSWRQPAKTCAIFEVDVPLDYLEGRDDWQQVKAHVERDLREQDSFMEELMRESGLDTVDGLTANLIDVLIVNDRSVPTEWIRSVSTEKSK